MDDLISVKGGKDGLRVQLAAAVEWAEVVAALRGYLEQSGSFFAGANLLVDVGERALTDAQLAEMLALLEASGVRPQALMAASRESRSAARSAGISARVAPPDSSQRREDVPPEGAATLLVRTVRSGQVVRHEGHVTLIGDVNAGAEIIAGGSVVVWGRLRGMVHAGALGDQTARICALELRPTQLRIANLIARTPEDAAPQLPVPEVAYVADGYITVEVWGGSRR
jgi:septum site-determining protein MinC